MPTYIETHIEDIIKVLEIEYKPLQVFDLEDANEKLDDPDVYSNDRVAMYLAFQNSNTIPNVINKNYESYSVSIWLLIEADTENETSQTTARDTNRQASAELIQRFQMLEAFRRVPENQTLNVSVSEGYDKFDSLLVWRQIAFTITIDTYEDTCAPTKGGVVSVLVSDYSDYDAITLDASTSTFRDAVVGGTQGTHNWAFDLEGTQVSISGNASDAISADDITALDAIGVESLGVSTYASLAFQKNPSLLFSKEGRLIITHNWEPRSNGLVSDTNTVQIESRAYSFVIDTSLTGSSSSNVTTFNTTSSATEFYLPLQNDSTVNFRISWGDGTEETITDIADANHTYASSGEYRLALFGTFDNFTYRSCEVDYGDGRKVTDLRSWNQVEYDPDNTPGYGRCLNMLISATNTPDLSPYTNLTSFLSENNVLVSIPNSNEWDTSTIITAVGIFQSSPLFNDPNIASWDVSNVTEFRSWFLFCSAFNQDISSWDTSSATRMQAMFAVTPFNQPIGSWNTGNVSDMDDMFNAATAFDQDLSGWDVTSLTTATNFMANGAGLSTNNYDATLISWAAQSVQNNVTIDFGSSKYSTAASSARQSLIDDHNWTILDGGLA